YGFYDYRGGGRGSGRTTIGHVIGGAVAKKLLELVGIKVVSHVTQVADVKAKHVAYGLIEEYASGNPVRCADEKAAILMEEKIMEAKEKGDSVGGVVETLAFGVPAGLGEPVFDKLDSDLARAFMGIGSVKGVEIGFGFQLAESTASVTNDEYYLEGKEIKTTTNTSGGIIGGISNGMPIVARMAVKPTPSISTVQKTVDLEKREETEIRIKGRHDPCICPRVTPVAESAMAMVLVDHLLRSGFINPRHV
ncbi:MAG: chorismate synthase, partial [Methanobacterium sp.]|nr:chorismate synthase [Methanobacterium sp.]